VPWPALKGVGTGEMSGVLSGDGVYSGLRSEDAKRCCLVVIGVDDRGRKSMLAIEDGVRESTLGRQDVLLDLKARGLNAPALAVGDGATGFRSALDRVYPNARHQRCRVAGPPTCWWLCRRPSSPG